MKQPMETGGTIKDRIVTGIFLDRDFDVPVSVYDELTSGSISMILQSFTTMTAQGLISKYSSNAGLDTFFTYIRNMLPAKSHKEVISVINKDVTLETSNVHDIILLLTYNDADWGKERKRLFSVSWNKVQPEWMLSKLITALQYPELVTQWATIFYSMLKAGNSSCELFLELKKSNVETTALVRLAYLIGMNRNYDFTRCLREIGVPVLYFEYEATDIVEYIESVLDTEYRGKLDDRMEQYLVQMQEDELVCMNDVYCGLLEIGNTLNQDNLKYYYIARGETEKDPSRLMKLLTAFIPSMTISSGLEYKNTRGYKMNSSGWVKDFRTLVTIMGERPIGSFIELQLLFLERGGDITTMVDENGKVVSDALILKMIDQVPIVMNRISVNSLRFLLLNCPEFVKCIMLSKDLTTSYYLHIARALLVNPVDEELWKLLNADENRSPDYRVYLLNKVISVISIEALFNSVPEALLYFEPSVLYITRNATTEMIPFIPVHKITQYIRQYIARSKYTRFNLLCRGENVTISSAIGDPQFVLMDIIVGNRKFGYICDLTLDQAKIPDLINEVAKLIQERQDK